MAGPMEFFHDMEEQGGPVNTYVGELYFSAHRGTYTSQAAIKKHNRRNELAMREEEFWSSLALGHGLDYNLAKADALWKELPETFGKGAQTLEGQAVTVQQTAL